MVEGVLVEITLCLWLKFYLLLVILLFKLSLKVCLIWVYWLYVYFIKIDMKIGVLQSTLTIPSLISLKS